MYDEVKPRGHHVNPQNRALANRELISDEGMDQLASSRVGDGGVSKGYSGDPHSGSHPRYDRAWQNEFDVFAKNNGIDTNNPMTRRQAIEFEGQLRQNAIVRQYLQDIADFMAERARLGRGRVNIRITNGVKGLD
jgi:hypothetical protein